MECPPATWGGHHSRGPAGASSAGPARATPARSPALQNSTGLTEASRGATLPAVRCPEHRAVAALRFAGCPLGSQDSGTQKLAATRLTAAAATAYAAGQLA